MDDEDEADDGYDEELERRRKEFQKRERLEKAGKLPQVRTMSPLEVEVYVYIKFNSKPRNKREVQRSIGGTRYW